MQSALRETQRRVFIIGAHIRSSVELRWAAVGNTGIVAAAAATIAVDATQGAAIVAAAAAVITVKAIPMMVDAAVGAITAAVRWQQDLLDGPHAAAATASKATAAAAAESTAADTPQ